MSPLTPIHGQLHGDYFGWAFYWAHPEPQSRTLTAQFGMRKVTVASLRELLDERNSNTITRIRNVFYAFNADVIIFGTYRRADKMVIVGGVVYQDNRDGSRSSSGCSGSSGSSDSSSEDDDDDDCLYYANRASVFYAAHLDGLSRILVEDYPPSAKLDRRRPEYFELDMGRGLVFQFFQTAWGDDTLPEIDSQVDRARSLLKDGHPDHYEIYTNVEVPPPPFEMFRACCKI
jgi:hypothetical protein